MQFQSCHLKGDAILRERRFTNNSLNAVENVRQCDFNKKKKKNHGFRFSLNRISILLILSCIFLRHRTVKDIYSNIVSFKRFEEKEILIGIGLNREYRVDQIRG